LSEAGAAVGIVSRSGRDPRLPNSLTLAEDYQACLQRLGEGELENYDGDTRAAAKFSNRYLDRLLAA
jgi:hypothetical protein